MKLLSIPDLDTMRRHISLNKIGNKLVTPPLQSVAFEPTNHCNLNCKMCFRDNREKGFMDIGLFNNLISGVIEYRKNISIGLNFAGEPLLHKKFIDMLSISASLKPLSIGFTTNGLLFNDKIRVAIKSLPNWSVAFSADGLEYSYKNIRGGDYYRLINNINSFTNSRKNNSGIIGINLIKFGQSDKEIQDYINFWINKLDYIAIGECLNNEIKINNKDEFIEKELNNRRVCLWSFRYMGVMWNGNIVQCCHDLNAKTKLKLTAAHSTLKDIWLSNEYKEIRLKHISKEFPKGSICKHCEAWVSPYLNILPKRLENNIIAWRHGLVTYYTKYPKKLGLKL